MLRTQCFGLLCALAVTCSAVPGWALDDQTKSTVRVLAVEAQADYDAGRFAEAGRKFQQALTVLEVPTLSVWAARSLVKTGKLLRATELYRRALKLTRNDNWVGAGQERVQQEANQELEALVARLAHLQVVLSDPPEGISVTINGVAVPRALLDVVQVVDPGKTDVVVRWDGKSKTETVTLAEGDTQRLVLTLDEPGAAIAIPATNPKREVVPATPPTKSEDAASSSSGNQRTMGWVGLSVGAAGLVTGTVGGILVASKSSRATYCSEHQECPNEVDSYNRWRSISTIGFVVGGVATAVGLTLLLTAPKSHNGPTVGLTVSPGMAQLGGTF